MTRKLLNIMCNIFKYDDLPDTITERELELKLMLQGMIALAPLHKEEYNGIYALQGNFGGPPNIHGEPTIFIPSYYKIAGAEISDWMVCYNTTSGQSIVEIVNNYECLLNGIMKSIEINSILSRASFVINVMNSTDKANADKWIKELIEGEIGSLVTSSSLIDEIKINPAYNTHNNITPLIEAYQYIKSLRDSDLGLPSSHNMKRESLNDSEVSIGLESVNGVLIDMLECRNRMCKEANRRYGTNISVNMRSDWRVEFENNIGLDETG